MASCGVACGDRTYGGWCVEGSGEREGRRCRCALIDNIRNDGSVFFSDNVFIIS